jgi:MFS family permease
MDVSAMGVALPAVRVDLGMTTDSLQWVMNAYVLGFGGFVLFGGRCADLLGARRVFLVALLVFIVFSTIGGLADDSVLLIISRFVTGVCSGFMAPAGMSLVAERFRGSRSRNRALLVYTGLSGAGWALGLVLGGLLTAIGWRLVLFVSAAIAMLVFAGALRLVPASRKPSGPGTFDIPGALLMTSATLVSVYAIVEAPETSVPPTAGLVAVAVGLFASLVMREHRTCAPLIRLAMLRCGARARTSVCGLLFIGGFTAFQFIAVLYMQELLRWSALETGFALLIVGADAVLAPLVTPRLIELYGTIAVVAAGMMFAAVGYGAFLGVDADWSYLQMLPTMALLGLAFTLAYGGLAVAALEGVPSSEEGFAAGMLNVSYQLGAAIGLALATAVYVSAADNHEATADLEAYRVAFLVPLAAALSGGALVAYGLRRGTRPR